MVYFPIGKKLSQYGILGQKMSRSVRFLLKFMIKVPMRDKKQGGDMIHLIQIIKYMMVNLEYTAAEVEEFMEALINEDMGFEAFFDTIGLEQPTEPQMDRIRAKIHLYGSALAVVSMSVETDAKLASIWRAM